MDVIKRDGRKVPFNKDKIIAAILAAFKEVDGEITSYDKEKATNIATYIEDITKNNTPIDIEEIQDFVEKGLMSTKRKDVAKAYILYREARTRERNRKSNMMRVVAEKISAENPQNQNANIDERSFGGRIGEATNEIMKQYALDYCMSDMARDNHLNNEIYIHDLNSYAVGMHNCLSVPFDELLANGFEVGQVDVRPPQSVACALQLVAVIFQLQSLQQFG